MLAITRAIKFAFQNFSRNVWLSLVTVIILSLSIFFITLMVGVRVVADQTLIQVRSKVDLSIFFKPEAAESQILELKSRLEQMPEVTTVTYVSKDQALASFKEQSKSDVDVERTIQALKENPLQASLLVRPRVLEQYPQILSVVNDPTYGKIIDQDHAAESKLIFIQRFSAITRNISRVGLGLSVIFALIAALVVFNTIRITIYAYREEIGIMKLVGASNAFIRAPFIIESIFYALIAAFIALGIIWLMLTGLAPFLNKLVVGYPMDLAAYLQGHFLVIFGPYGGLALLLSMLSSGVAVGRYLRV